MAVPDLPEELHKAGGEYLTQLRSLGLKPEGFFWVHRLSDGAFVLQMIWSGLDRFGPLSVSKLLFQAYRASALTRAIDPMFVDVRSPQEHFATGFLKYIAEFKDRPDSRFMRVTNSTIEDEGVIYQWDTRWVYHIQSEPRSYHKVRADWGRFKSKVEALAA